MKVQIFIQYLCMILYLMYHQSLGIQSRRADVMTRPSSTKLAYTDSNTLTYISLGTQLVGGGGILPPKVAKLVVF